MFDLIYCSIASENLSGDDIRDILTTSRNFNSENDITGCLIYHNNQFIQILEGEKKVVKDLYSRIQKDHRHSTVMLLSEQVKEQRFFDNWSMAFYELDINNAIIFSKLVKNPTHAIRLFGHAAQALMDKED